MPEARKLSILVVADASPDADALFEVLRAEGYVYAHARDFSEVLQLGRARDPDIVFVSSTLPAPGCQALCGMLKEDTHEPDLPVILLARDPSDEIIARAWSAGYDDFIRCPLQRPAVLARLAWATKNCQLRDEVSRIGAEQQEFLSGTSDAVFFVQPDALRIVEANRRAAELTDLPPGKVAGHPLDNLLLLEQTELSRGELMALRPGEKLETTAARIMSAEARVTRVSVTVRAVRTGGERRLMVTCRDNPGRRELDTVLQRRNRELTAINEISTLIARTLNVDAMLPDVVPLTMSAVRADGLLVCLIDGNDMIAKASEGALGEAARGLYDSHPDWPARLCRHVAEQQEPLAILTDASDDSRIGWGDVEEMPVASYVGVPLRSEERMHGVLAAVTLEESGRLFDEGNATLLTSIGSQLGMALANSFLYRETQKRATTDALTGILNRGAFMSRLENELARALRHDARLSLIMCDVNRFKTINDTRGHLVGDMALKVVARVFAEVARGIGFCGRYGGDEFCLLLPKTAGSGALEVAERLRTTAAQQEIRPEGQEPLSLSLGLGVAELGHPIETADEFVRVADDALYEAKRGGANPCLGKPAAVLPPTSQ